MRRCPWKKLCCSGCSRVSRCNQARGLMRLAQNIHVAMSPCGEQTCLVSALSAKGPWQQTCSWHLDGLPAPSVRSYTWSDQTLSHYIRGGQQILFFRVFPKMHSLGCMGLQNHSGASPAQGLAAAASKHLHGHDAMRVTGHPSLGRNNQGSRPSPCTWTSRQTPGWGPRPYWTWPAPTNLGVLFNFYLIKAWFGLHRPPEALFGLPRRGGEVCTAQT